MAKLVPLLNVTDVSRSLSFYATVLGAVASNQWEHEGRLRWAHIRFDGGELMLNTPDAPGLEERAARAEFADVVLYWNVDDARALRERLAAEGLAVGELVSESYGNDEFSLRDPDGYALRIASPRP